MIKFKINFDRVINSFGWRQIKAEIFSDAKNPRDGFRYFRAVDLGRPALGPKNFKNRRTKFFRIPFPDRVVYTRRVRKSRPVRIRIRALRDSMKTLRMLSESFPLSGVGVRKFVHRAATVIVRALIRYTPRRKGRLAQSYRITSPL